MRDAPKLIREWELVLPAGTPILLIILNPSNRRSIIIENYNYIDNDIDNDNNIYICMIEVLLATTSSLEGE